MDERPNNSGWALLVVGTLCLLPGSVAFLTTRLVVTELPLGQEMQAQREAAMQKEEELYRDRMRQLADEKAKAEVDQK